MRKAKLFFFQKKPNKEAFKNNSNEEKEKANQCGKEISQICYFFSGTAVIPWYTFRAASIFYTSQCRGHPSRVTKTATGTQLSDLQTDN